MTVGWIALTSKWRKSTSGPLKRKCQGNKLWKSSSMERFLHGDATRDFELVYCNGKLICATQDMLLEDEYNSEVKEGVWLVSSSMYSHQPSFMELEN